MKYDLVVAYRIYPKISKPMALYPNDKYKLAQSCLESFKKSLSGLKVKIYVLLDGCPPEYASLFKDNFDPDDLVLMPLEACGNKNTFKKQIEILSAQNESDIVYFAEDDYFYIENLKNMVDFIRSGTADFVTPYEHPSCYADGHVISNMITIFDNKRYTTVQHACLTFMTTKKNLLKNKRYFLIYPNWFGSDFVVWGCITLGFSYFKYIGLIFHPRNFTLETLKVYGCMWFFAWQRFLVNKKYTLFMPIPTIATHVEKKFLAPCIDWNQYFKDKK